MTSRPQLLAVEPLLASEPRGEIVAAHRLARDCLVILGRVEGGIAAEGAVTVATSGGDRGRFRAVSWSSGDASREHWYVAALRVPEASELKSGESLALQSVGSKTPIPATLPPLLADSTAFAAELRSRTKSKLDEAVRFLLETFSSRASRQLPTVSAFLTAILDSASEEEGVVETLGAIDGEGLLLQGWLGSPIAGRQRLLLLGTALEEHEAICANFSRSDLEGRGHGVLALVRAKGGVVAEVPRRVYVQAGDRFCRLNVLPDAVRLHHDETCNRLRIILPSVLGDDNLRQTLDLAARPRYSGIDTVSSLDRPVRMVVDLAARVSGVGWYVVGWLLDPANLVTAVVLRGRDGVAESLDVRWTRVPRPDVNASFRDDPVFQGLIATDSHGFTVFVPDPKAAGEIWLELQFGDGHQAFMPLRVLSGDGASGQKRLLESFDIRKPSAQNIVEHHLGPLFHAAKSAPKRKIEHGALRDRKAGGPALEVALIVPITEPETRTKFVVSQLAARDPGPGVVPIFVCSSAISEAASTLLRELDFYALDAIVLLSTEPVSACEALEIGVRATRAAKLVFMLPSTHPLQAHWAAQLAAFLDNEGGPAVASPTLLYEDWSICYGGIDDVRFLDAAPFADAASARAGYPRESMSESGVTPTLAASLACCAMQRSVFEQVDGFGAGYALARLGGLDLFLRMRAAGIRMIWVPQLEAFAVGDAGAQNEYCNRTGELVDGWSLRASWKNRLPPVIGLASNAAAGARDQSVAADSGDIIRTDVQDVDMSDDFRATGTENG